MRADLFETETIQPRVGEYQHRAGDGPEQELAARLYLQKRPSKSAGFGQRG